MKQLTSWAPKTPVFYATILLFALCLIAQPRSVNATALNSMLPFAAVLAVASIGQTLVVQQRGVDLSVASTMTLSAAIVSLYPHDNSELFTAIVLCVGIGAVIGFVLGFVVTYLQVTPLIATFGVNAVVGGIVLAYANSQTNYVPPDLNKYATGKTLGIQNLVWTAVIFVLVAAFVASRTSFGRRFAAVGASYDAARASGIRVMALNWSAYMMSSVCYAIAGIMIAGFVNVPNLSVGSSYVMPSIAAVVLGGTLFSGGRGHMIGTGVAALLLSQLNQFVLSIGAPTAVQLIVQGVVIAVAAIFQTTRGAVLARGITKRLRPRGSALTSGA